MPTLEMVADKERLERTIVTLQTRLPRLSIVAKSAFFAILSCEIAGPLTDMEKRWLEASSWMSFTDGPLFVL